MSTLSKIGLALVVVAVVLCTGVVYVATGSRPVAALQPLELHWDYDEQRRIVVCKPPDCEGGPPFCCRIHKGQPPKTTSENPS